MIAACAAENVACPETYAGNGGVKCVPSVLWLSGCHVGSGVVAELPSVAASRIALAGRHRSRSREYLASQATTAASPRVSATSAKRRAFSTTSRLRWLETVFVISNSWPGGLYVPSRSLAQKNAIFVCSSVRTTEL